MAKMSLSLRGTGCLQTVRDILNLHWLTMSLRKITYWLHFGVNIFSLSNEITIITNDKMPYETWTILTMENFNPRSIAELLENCFMNLKWWKIHVSCWDYSFANTSNSPFHPAIIRQLLISGPFCSNFKHAHKDWNPTLWQNCSHYPRLILGAHLLTRCPRTLMGI